MEREELLILGGWSTLVWAGSRIFGRTAGRCKANAASELPKKSTQHPLSEAANFAICAQLLEGKHEVAKLPLCTVLICDDQRYPWLVLVPRLADAVEVVDLSIEQQSRMWEEVGQASRIVQRQPGVEKLNVATLGNVCSQLHIHVTGRHDGDAAWPGPCYGVGAAVPYAEDDLEPWLDSWRSHFDAAPQSP